MFEVSDSEQYAVQSDVFKEIINNAMRGFIKKQNNAIKQILADLGISEADFISHGSKNIMSGMTTLFYKDKPIAVFTKEEIKTEGYTTTLSQKYKILK